MIEKRNYLKHQRLPFTQINNEIINILPDWGSLGLYTYLCSKPENWVICKIHLQNRFKVSENTLRKKLKILEQYGLFKKYPVRNEQGKITHWESILFWEIEKQICANENNAHDCTSLKPAPDKDVIQNAKNHYVESCDVDSIYITKEGDLKIKNIYKCKSDLHKSEIDKKFEEFWNLYPLKKNKKRSKGIWVREKIYEKWDEIKEKLVNQLNNCTSFKEHPTKGKKYFMHPSTYLNGENWNDEITTKQNKAVTTGNAETIQPVFVHDEEAARKRHDEKFGIGKFNTNSFPIAEQIQNITKKLRLNASKGVVKKRSE